MNGKRDYNIDFFRGLAAVWIIFIHTCFWSGESYVPFWLKQLSLIIDVPLFIFISGMSFNFSNSIVKNIKGIIKLWGKYLIFLIVYFIILFLIDRDNFSTTNIVHGIFFNLSVNNKLMVVAGSFWFIYMFIAVSFFSSIIIKIYNHFFHDLTNFKYILLFVFLLYGMSLYNWEFMILRTQTLLYMFVYLLGYYFYNYKINLKTFIFFEILMAILFLFTTIFCHYGFDIQLAKSNCNMSYLVYSMFSIIVLIYLKDKVVIKKNSFLTFIGKNALLFYFCQGIGSSAIYLLLDFTVRFPLIIRIPIMFIINFIITFIFSVIIYYILKLWNILIKYLKTKNKLICIEYKYK